MSIENGNNNGSDKAQSKSISLNPTHVLEVDIDAVVYAFDPNEIPVKAQPLRKGVYPVTKEFIEREGGRRVVVVRLVDKPDLVVSVVVLHRLSHEFWRLLPFHSS